MAMATGAIVMNTAIPEATPQLPISWWLALAAATWVGMLDDLAPVGNSPRKKLAGQTAVAALVAAAGYAASPALLSLDGLEILRHPAWLVIGLGMGVLLMNAYNLVDNSNGACAGLGLLAATGILVMSLVGLSIASFGAEELTMVRRDTNLIRGWERAAHGSALLIGGLLAVLPFNYPRAKIFLGDAGSHLVGAVLTALTLALVSLSGQVLFVPILFAVPLADVVWVVALRLREKRPIMVGDREHLAHRIGRRFDSSARAVAVLWLACLCTSGLAVVVMWGTNTVARLGSVAATLVLVAVLYVLAADDRPRDVRHGASRDSSEA